MVAGGFHAADHPAPIEAGTLVEAIFHIGQIKFHPDLFVRNDGFRRGSRLTTGCNYSEEKGEFETHG